MRLRALAPLAALGLLACDASSPIAPMGATGAAGMSGGGTPLPVGLTPADVARKLSSFIWNAQADDALVAQLYAEPPTTTDDVRRLATSMLADSRARDGARAFFHQWLRLDRLGTAKKDPTRYPEYTPALRDAMIAEAEAFALDVTFDGDGRFPTLLTADFSMLNETLAPLYGVTGVSGPELRKVSLDPARRAGIFTLPAVLASAPDSALPAISARGAFVLALVSKPAPPPPAGLPMPSPTAGAQGERAVLQAMLSNAPACTGCHDMMDPPGFAFTHYDALGRYQDTEGGMAIDATGFWGPRYPIKLTFDGARDLAQQLADVPDMADFFVTSWFTFAGAANDSAGLEAARTEFTRHDLDIRSLIVAVTASAAFLAP